jgi:dihydroxyacetone kinase-like predicted kinase
VVGGGGLYNVHIHTNEPKRAIEMGAQAGRAHDVRVADLRDQVTRCLAGQARGVRIAEQRCALLTVAEGEGVRRALRSLGALVVAASPGRLPSAAALVAAIDAAPSDTVVILPDHGQLDEAIERATQHTSKEIRIVPARSVPAVLSAAAVFNPLASLEENAKLMEEAAAACRSGQVARAERDGDWLGMSDGDVVAAGADPGPIAVDLVRRLGSDLIEMVTVVEGVEASTSDRQSVEEALRRAFPDLAVEIVDGGQHGHPFLIGVE